MSTKTKKEDKKSFLTAYFLELNEVLKLASPREDISRKIKGIAILIAEFAKRVYLLFGIRLRLPRGFQERGVGTA